MEGSCARDPGVEKLACAKQASTNLVLYEYHRSLCNMFGIKCVRQMDFRINLYNRDLEIRRCCRLIAKRLTVQFQV